MKKDVSRSLLIKGTGVIFLMLLLSCGVWLAIESQKSNPAKLYAEWLASRKGPAPMGRLEKWANQMGIRSFTNARLRADSRMTEALLEHEDYAVAVASWWDSTVRPAPATLATWPYVERALVAQMEKPGSEGLEAALSRADAAGFAKWEDSLARSAYRHGAMEELASIQEALREFESKHFPDTIRSDSLQRISELYAMSPADLGRALFRAEDPTAESVVISVLTHHGMTSRQAADALLAEWKLGGVRVTDWELVGKIARDTRLGDFRKEFLTWFALSPESETWRSKQRAVIREVLDELRGSDPAFARELASHLVRETVKRTGELGSDWKLVSGILLSVIGSESDLKVMIDDEVGLNFVWLCHQIDAEELLNRAVKVWNDSMQNRARWIGEFIDAGHYRAACILIEEAKEQEVYIRSQRQRAAQSHPASLAEYLELYERLAAHADTPQLKGFIHLELGNTAVLHLNGNYEKSLARKEVLKALEVLNQAECPNWNLLELTASRLVVLDNDLFEAGRPTFDKWRRGVTPEEFLTRLVRDEWRGDEREWHIWRTYFREHSTRSELPELAAIIATLIRSSSEDNAAARAAKRIGDLLGAGTWQIPESGNLELASWVLKKMIAESQWEESSKWMFARMEEFRIRFPEADDTIVLREIYKDLLSELNRRRVRDSLRWLGAVLDEEIAASFIWPAPFERIMYRYPGSIHPKTLQSIEERFGAHSLRRWIARGLLLDGLSTTEDWKESREHILEWVRQPWLKDVINEHLDNTFDMDAFERDMARAAPGARRYFAENPFLPRRRDSFPKHPSGRDHTDVERMRYHLWKAEQSLEIVEKGEFFDASAFKWLFSDLFDLAEARSDDPRLQTLARRLQNAPFEENLERRPDFELEVLREMQDRAAHFVAPETPKGEVSK